MTPPSDSFSSFDPDGSQDCVYPHPFSSPLDEVLNARLRGLMNAYYSSLFRHRFLQQEILYRQSLGACLSEVDQRILGLPYPTLAQYLAYVSRLDATKAETPLPEEEPGC